MVNKFFFYEKFERYFEYVILNQPVFFTLMSLFQVSISINSYLKDISKGIEGGVAVLYAIYGILPSFSIIFMLSALLMFIPWKKVQKVVRISILLFTGILCISDAFLLYQYQDILDQAKIVILMGSDPETIKEFLEEYVWNYNVCISVLTFLIIIAFIIVGTRRIIRDNINKYFMHSITIVLVVSMLIFGTQVCRSMVNDYKHYKNIQGSFGRVVYHDFVPARFLIDYYMGYISIGSDKEIFDEMNRMMTSNEYYNATSKKGGAYVVFILGESIDRNHMSLYGYSLETSPRLKKRFANKELAVYNDTISCANSTAAAMSLILTTAPKSHEKKWYEYPNLMDAMHEAGYTTAWISNQEPLGRWGNFDYIFSKRADFANFLHVSGGVSGDQYIEYDEKIIQPLKKLLDGSQEKMFCVLHLFGAHESFKTRYPAKFSKFCAKDEPGPSEERAQKQAEYDNAVYYDDYVIDEIYRLFEDKDAIIFYVSDHGMDLYDTSNIAGHTREEKGSRHMIEVPFIIWASNSYREKNQETWNAIVSSVNRPYRTDYLMHTIMDVLGIETNFKDNRFSIINNDYVPVQRIYNGEIYELNVSK